MTNIIPLTKIGFFNPGRLSDQEIEESFIARVPFFEFIFKKIAAEKPNSIPQHHLIIGQRGMGKSSLLVRIAAELRKAPYRESFIPLSFPEEQYNIDRLSKFWLNCLDALADALDKENRSEDLPALDQEISSLSKEKNLSPDSVYASFEKWVHKIKRRPVLLVDNLNLIFSKINKEEQHQLRAILISKGAPILVGASATAIDETVDYQAPFYDAFQINYIQKLTFQESLEVLINLARITGNPDFKNSVYTQKGRLEALYQLTGGTPRTLAILFPLIQNGFSDDIQTDLDALLDIITPLYKARFEELPEQLQVVMDAVALHWDPINLEQLREKTMLENGQLSPQLKRLIEVGWLQKMDAYKAKGGAYELSERFFNVWYLMRRSSRRQKRELYCLTKFLESFYGSDLNEIARNRISCKSESANHIALDLALADAVKEKDLSEQLRNKGYNALFDMSLTDDGILKDFTIPKKITQERVADLFREAGILYRESNYADAELKISALLKLEDSNKYAWNNLGVVYGYQNKNEQAEAAYKKAIEIDEMYFRPWANLGSLYSYNSRLFKEAEAAYKKAIELKKDDILSWSGLGHLYTIQGNLKEAETAYQQSLSINDKDSFTWSELGNLYNYHLLKYKEAEAAYQKSIELSDTYAYPWNGLGNLYSDGLKLYDKAEIAYKKAIELDEHYKYPLNGLGTLYQDNLHKYEESELAYKKAVEIDPNYAIAWNGMGNLYLNHLNKYKEAEMAYLKALEINSNDLDSLNNIGILYQDFLGKYLESESAFKKILEAVPNDNMAKYNLVFLWRDKMGKLAEAKALFDSIIVTEDLKDSHLLNEALFAYYDKNVGIAEAFVKDALLTVNESLPDITSDDWYRSAAVIVKLGYGNSLLSVFVSTGHDIIFRPLYIAIEALTKNEGDLFLNSIAAEIREPAKKIMTIMQSYLK